MCQRPRCWYFRSGMGLMPTTKDGKSMVVAGDNRYAAILGNQGGAYFVSPSTIAPVLIAYGAKIRIYSAKAAGSGVRELPLGSFFVTPKSANEREHDLKPGRDGDRTDRAAAVAKPEDRLLRGAAEGGVRLAPGAWQRSRLRWMATTVKSARIVLGHVAPVPWVSDEAAQALIGKPVTAETAMAAANAALAQCEAAQHEQVQSHAGQGRASNGPCYRRRGSPAEVPHDDASRSRAL